MNVSSNKESFCIWLFLRMHSNHANFYGRGAGGGCEDFCLGLAKVETKWSAEFLQSFQKPREVLIWQTDGCVIHDGRGVCDGQRHLRVHDDQILPKSLPCPWTLANPQPHHPRRHVGAHLNTHIPTSHYIRI